jgi:NAD(P)-dependent dehydrogenase (short-subunit alcohol dehydrogenase family)
MESRCRRICSAYQRYMTVLFNNAGISVPAADLLYMTDEDIDR